MDRYVRFRNNKLECYEQHLNSNRKKYIVVEVYNKISEQKYKFKTIKLTSNVNFTLKSVTISNGIITV